MKQEWLLNIVKGRICVEHVTHPHFITRINIYYMRQSPRITFAPKWIDEKPTDMNDELGWYLKAFDVYNRSPESKQSPTPSTARPVQKRNGSPDAPSAATRRPPGRI